MFKDTAYKMNSHYNTNETLVS